MDGGRLGGLLVERDPQLLGRAPQLAGEVLPLAHAHVVQVLGLAALAELAAGERALLLAQVAPEVEVGEEVRGLVGEARVLLVGLRALLLRALARVLDRERGDDRDHLGGAVELARLEDHPAHPRVDLELRQAPAGLRQAPVAVDRPQLLQQPDAVADLAAVGRVQEREVLDVAELERGHPQDHRGEVGAQDLGVGEARALLEVLLGVEADRDAVGRAPAAALALVGGRLRDRLDRQPLDLQPRAVAADARRARVDDRADPGHGQRRLGDVGREHHAGLRVRLEHPLLLGVGQPRVERQQLDRVGQPAAQRLGGVADLALAGEEHEHVAAALAQQRLARAADRVDDVLVLLERRVADLDGVRAPRHLDDRRAAEVAREALGVDRRRGDDQLQVRPLGEQAGEVAEQEVDVEAALVRLVDDHGVVAAQQRVAVDLGQQQAVGDEPHQRVLRAAVAEAHGVPDRPAERHLQLVRDPLGHRARGEPARLRVGDRAADAAAELEAELGDLRRLARAGLARHDDDLVVADRLQQVLAAAADRQLGRIRHRGHGGTPLGDAGLGALDVGLQLAQGRRVGVAPDAVEPPLEPVRVAQRQLAEAGAEVGGGRGHRLRIWSRPPWTPREPRSRLR